MNPLAIENPYNEPLLINTVIDYSIDIITIKDVWRSLSEYFPL